jgi:hypothetical protein
MKHIKKDNGGKKAPVIMKDNVGNKTPKIT